MARKKRHEANGMVEREREIALGELLGPRAVVRREVGHVMAGGQAETGIDRQGTLDTRLDRPSSLRHHRISIPLIGMSSALPQHLSSTHCSLSHFHHPPAFDSCILPWSSVRPTAFLSSPFNSLRLCSSPLWQSSAHHGRDSMAPASTSTSTSKLASPEHSIRNPH